MNYLRNPASDFGLRFYLAKGPEERRSYVLDVVSSAAGEVDVLWTDDESTAVRFNSRCIAEMLRDVIMAADVARRTCIALMPEA